jgi:hypothetical protein
MLALSSKNDLQDEVVRVAGRWRSKLEPCRLSNRRLMLMFAVVDDRRSKLIYRLVGCLPVQPNNMHGPKGAVCRRVCTPGASSYRFLIGDPPPPFSSSRCGAARH